MRPRRVAAWLLPWLAVFAAIARGDDAHDRIEQERAVANARFAERQRDCAARFVASPCLDAARQEHQDVLNRLRQQQLQLDERVRREAAEARRRALDTRAADAVERGRTTAKRPEVLPASSGAASVPAPGRLFPTPGSLQRESQPTAAARSERERRSIARYEARAAEVAAHRRDVELRNAERAAKGKAAAPLPAAGASAAPR